MLTMTQVERFSQLPSPLLTVYVSKNLGEAWLHGSLLAHLAWMRDESRPIAHSLPSDQKDEFIKELNRVEEFLKQRASHERSIVIFAGPSVWEILPLQCEVQNELHWGKPALSQLIWLASEHKPYGIVAVDHAGSHFFHYWCGELIEHEERRFAIDISEWKKKDLGHVSGQGVIKTRGSQRDVFAKRMENLYAHLCRDTALRAVSLCTTMHLAAVFLVGPDELIDQIQAHFPANFRQPIVPFDQDLARVSLLELLKHIEPQIADFERRREAALVTATTSGDEKGTVAGFDETFAQLQKGNLRTLVIPQGFDTVLHECVQCSLMDRSGDPLCSVCAGNRRTVTLRDALPELARRHHVEIEVVSGEAAEQLKRNAEMAAWLRQPKSVSAKTGS